MDLAVKNREKFGKAVKSLRRQGMIPAELYGRGLKNLHLSVPTKDFLKVFKEAGTNTIVNLLLDKDLPARLAKAPAERADGQERRPALVYEVKKDYLTDEIIHVDFYQVRMDERIKAKVPIEFEGEAPAVKDKGGILNKAMSEIEVESLPADLPRRLLVNLSLLDDLNKSVYVREIKVPQAVKVLVDPETVVVTVTPPVVEEEKVEAPVDIGAVKVEDEEKKAERAVEKKTGKPTEETSKQPLAHQ
jgi:large subunit ribosomal protein L25